MEQSFLRKNFCKTAGCPSSQKLLSYRRQRLPLAQRGEIETHLRACDFCSAELQLLKCHSADLEEYRSVEMPRQLRRLAEDLFRRHPSPFELIALGGYRGSH